MKRYGPFIIILLALFVSMSNVKALKVGTCDVLISYKANSSSDNDIFICKNQRFGNPTDSIYYEGSGNKVVLNNFNAYYLALNSNVVLDIGETNSISLFHTGEYQVNITGKGVIKFKEDSYVKKINNGELVYNYLYQGRTVVNSEKLIYEGTEKEFISDYKELAKVNNLPSEYNEEDYEKVQAIDYISMTSVSITDEWMDKHIVTNLSKSVEDGYGIVRYEEVKKEETQKTDEDETKTLKSEKVILVSEKKINAKYKLDVEEKTHEKEKYEDQIEDYQILSLYDVNVYNGKKLVTMKNGHYTIKIKLDENDNYQNHKIIYVDNDGKVAEYIDGVIEDGYIVFETSHLSQYGVIAEEVNDAIVIEPKISKKEVATKVFKLSVLGIYLIVASLIITIVIIKSGLIKRKRKRRA